MSTDWRPAAAWLVKLGLGLLLVYAGAMKLLDPAAFAEEIANYRMLPALAPFLAVTLPSIEVVLGLLLVGAPLGSGWLPPAALGALVLMTMFTTGVTQVVLRGIDTSCGCFGADSGPVSWWTVLRVVGLAGLSAWLLRYTIGMQRQLVGSQVSFGAQPPQSAGQ